MPKKVLEIKGDYVKKTDDPKPKRKPKAINAITFWLPLPGRALSPNGRGHWGKKARAVKLYRESAMMAATAAYMPHVKPMWPKAVTKLTFNFHSPNRRDRDNFLASMKSAFDGMVDAGIVTDDSGLSHGTVEFTVDKGQPAGVMVTVERA